MFLNRCLHCLKPVSVPTGDCPHCGAHLDLTPKEALEVLRRNPAVKAIRVLVHADACAACRYQEGTYAPDAVPLLPVPECSHGQCRCYYEPLLDDIFP